MINNNSLERKFNSYIGKVIYGYAKDRKKLINKYGMEEEYTNFINHKFSLNKPNEEDAIIENLENDYRYPENAFSDEKYYLAMKNIRLNHRQAFYLLVVENKSINEVAEILDLKPSTVKKIKKKVREQFIKNLEDLK